MQNEKIIAIFDQQASSYNQKWSELAPLNNALHLLTGAVLAKLPAEAHMLCVGRGHRRGDSLSGQAISRLALYSGGAIHGDAGGSKAER